MALSIAVGFVVDDAIVMEEVIWQKIEHGEDPKQAALDGSGEISFTILTISISLVAVFTPLMFMGGVVGRLMSEFAFTLSAAVVLSIILSLTVTPMLASLFLRKPKPPSNRFTKGLERGFTAIERGYARGLDTVLRHMFVTLLVFLATAGLAVFLYMTTPTGFFPQQDTGFLERGGAHLPERLVQQARRQGRTGRGRHPQRPRRPGGGLLRRQSGRQSIQHQHHASTPRPGPQGQRDPDHRPPAAQARPARRRSGAAAGQSGHQRRRTRGAGAVPVHRVGQRPERAEFLGARASSTPCARSRSSRT